MSEQEKSLGTIAYKAWSEQARSSFGEDCWEAAAQAVAARVKEECAEILTAAIHPDNNDSWNAALMFGAKSIRAMNEVSQ